MNQSKAHKFSLSLILSTLLALAISLLIPNSANARTTVTGGPYTNLALTGQIVTLKLSGYPTNTGLYIAQCVRAKEDDRPVLCNPAAHLWISTASGASFPPTADIQFKPTALFNYGNTAVDCTKAACGIFIRYDHGATWDRSEDQFIPITFVGGATPSPSPSTDIIKVTVNGRSLNTSVSYQVRYKDVLTLVATTRSGVTATIASLSTGCSVSGNQVTILKGSGFCDIAVTSPGNTQYASVTSHYLFRLNPGVQKVTISNSARVGTTITLPATSNFGEKVTYTNSSTTNCTLNGNALTFNKQGACSIRATAAALADSYSALKQTISFKIR